MARERFKDANHPCPICGGHDRLSRESDARCGGFLSSDGRYALCTNGGYAGGLRRSESGTFSHWLGGACRCGVGHGVPHLTSHTVRQGATVGTQRAVSSEVNAVSSGVSEKGIARYAPTHDGTYATERDMPPPASFPAADELGSATGASPRQIVATYDYTDARGLPLFQVVRFAPKGFAQRRQDAEGRWVYNLDGVTPTLYRLPELLMPYPGTVFVVEGEKDVDALYAHGLTATCNPMGAGKWRDSYSPWLTGFDVVILPDNDLSGIVHAERVAQSIAGCAASVKVVTLPDVPHKGDVSDYLATHSAFELLSLAKLAPLWTKPQPSPEVEGHEVSASLPASESEKVDAALVSFAVRPAAFMRMGQLRTLPPTEWLFAGQVVKRGLNMLYGPSESGKSFLALDYALRLAQTAPVIYIAAEDPSGYTSRVEAWCAYTKSTEGDITFYTQPVNLMSLSETLAFIEHARPYAPALVVIDTMAWCMAAFGGEENAARDVMQFVRHVHAIRATLDTTLLIVHHTGKTGAAERGSAALKQAMDAVIEVSASDDLVKVECAKTKNAPHFAPLHYRRLPFADSCVLVSAAIAPAPKTSGPSSQQLDVLEKLSMEIFADCGAKGAQLTAMFGLSNKTETANFYHVLSVLKKSGYLRHGMKGDPYFITDAGRDVLKTYRPPLL